MSGSARTAWSGVLLNIGLAVGGLLVLVLLWAFVTRALTPTATPERTANPAGLVGDIVQVEVRNGCGVPGLAADVTQYLRRHGFDVVASGNFTNFSQERSLVIDRVGNRDAALNVAAILGIAEEYVIEDVRDDYYLDASVVIGRDYLSLRPFEGAADS